MYSLHKIISSYEKLRADRDPLGKKFLSGERPYMIFQTPDGNVWGDVRSPEQCFGRNLDYVKASLEIPSDHLPVLEPWFGCPYVWRDGEAPAFHNKYHTLDEVVNLRKPEWEEGEAARLVIDTIRYFKTKKGMQYPLCGPIPNRPVISPR